MSELVSLTPADEVPQERVVAVLRQALEMAEAGELRAVALAGTVRVGPADLRGHYAWAGSSGGLRPSLIAGLEVVRAELVDSIRAELEDAEADL
jgi:hypothetical protein